jgi:hypothetical protein
LTQQELAKTKNLDLRASLAAMQRAAKMARQAPIQTDSGIIVVRDSKPLRISAKQLREGQERNQSANVECRSALGPAGLFN